MMMMRGGRGIFEFRFRRGQRDNVNKTSLRNQIVKSMMIENKLPSFLSADLLGKISSEITERGVFRSSISRETMKREVSMMSSLQISCTFVQ